MAKKKYNTILSPDTLSKETQLAQQIYAQKPYTKPATKENQQAILEAKKTINPLKQVKPVLPITSPSLGRLGIRPTTSQIEQQKAQALQDIKRSALTRANVGAMQGLSPIGFKLGEEEQAILDKSKAYKAGEIVGTMAGFALPYAGLGKGVLQGTAKLAPRLVPSASGAISKGITRLAPKVATETAEKVGKGITESLIKDIAIGTPMNVAYAYGKEDLSGTDALKNIAFNTGLDLITGGILEAVPLVLKSGKKVASKAEFEALPKEEQDEVIQLLLPAPKEAEAKMIPENRVIAGGQILERQFKPISKEEYLTKTASRINKLDDAQRKLKTKVLTQEEFSDIGKLALDEYDKTVKSIADYMSNYKPKGTETTILPKYGDELMRDGAIRTTISNNDIWYQDFYKKFGRKPNKSEIPELAENLVKQSLKNKSGEFYNEALGNMLDEIKNVKVGTADNTIKRQLDKLTDELTSTIGMTDEEFSKYAQTRQLGKLVTAEPTPPLQFKTQITADELLKAQNKALEPQKLEKGIIAPQTAEAGLKRDLETKEPESMTITEKIKKTVPDRETLEKPIDTKTLLSSKSNEDKLTTLEKLGGITSTLKRKFSDTGDTVTKIVKKTGDKTLYNYYNNARGARTRALNMIDEEQRNLMGDKVGKGLKDIFKPITDKGDDYYRNFQDYMFSLHNIDRMREGKPVFGEGVSAEMSVSNAERLLKEFPEFAQYKQEVDNYLNNLMQMRVDAGLVSKDLASTLNSIYKNYVPTYRQIDTKAMPIIPESLKEKLKPVIKTGIETATGSGEKLIPLHEQLIKQTIQTVEASTKNLFAQRLLKNINPETSQYIRQIKPVAEQFDIDAEIKPMPKAEGKFKTYVEGNPFEVEVDKTLYEGIQALNATPPEELVKLITQANKGLKELITSYSPLFLVKNFVRDLQDVGIYSKNLKGFAESYPQALKEMTTDGELWKKYKALGGGGASFFDYTSDIMKDKTWLRKNTVDRIEQINMATEQLPRFTEFLATIKKLDRPPTYDDLMDAMFNAADVTVNFGRSGSWGKVLNSTFVPFFNPAMQGSAKFARLFTETKGVKDWTSLIIKLAALGVAPSAINEMLLGDDPEYQKINNRDKDTNYIFKLDKENFVKIPKGRVLSLFGATGQRISRDLEGKEAPYADLLTTAKQQIAPISPFESNIVSPIQAAAQNKTWYGGQIEPMRLQKFRPSQRYDESTTELSKRLVNQIAPIADKINLSPKKLDYIIDAYSGIIGDVAIPKMTPKAETSTLKKAFTIDTVLQNQIADNYYTAKTEISQKRAEEKGGYTYDVMSSYINKKQKEVDDINKAIRNVENNPNITDKVKRTQVRELKKQVNLTQLEALSKLKEIKSTTFDEELKPFENAKQFL